MIALISHTIKVMLKILQAKLWHYVNWELPDDLEKAEEPEIKLKTSIGSLIKQRIQKSMYFYFIDYTNTFGCVDHNKLCKIL